MQDAAGLLLGLRVDVADPAGRPAFRSVPRAIVGSTGSAIHAVSRLSRPNRVMNQGAPAATKTSSGWSVVDQAQRVQVVEAGRHGELEAGDVGGHDGRAPTVGGRPGPLGLAADLVALPRRDRAPPGTAIGLWPPSGTRQASPRSESARASPSDLVILATRPRRPSRSSMRSSESVSVRVVATAASGARPSFTAKRSARSAATSSSTSIVRS